MRQVAILASSVSAAVQLRRIALKQRLITPPIAGQNNTAAHPPTYCPPSPLAQEARLAGRTTHPMGPYEPVVCKIGNYCPPGGAQQIECPSSHFCSIGAYKPTKCSLGALCPPGSYRDRSLLPLILLIILDVILVAAILVSKVSWNGSRGSRRDGGKGAKRLRKALTFSRLGIYNEQYLPVQECSIPLEPRISGVRRANTSFLAAMENDFAFGESYTANNDRPDSTVQQFVKSLSRSTIAASIGLSFEFENLSFQPKGCSQPLLAQVTGEITSGSLWGVMGASGAGKSTFVNVLMGKHSHTGGMTKINGSAGVSSKYKKVIGYVPQDDIVLPELTVRENILHSARIRLPSYLSDKDIQTHVDLVLKCLKLSHVQDSRVGSTAAPIISGGERKRVSIGMELAAAPMALFLDEPTSGLDATSASSIMSILKAVSSLGITVVTIIHQPRHEIFKALDSILLLGAGRVVYSGKEADAQAYFEDCGFSFPEGHNPADTIMDIIAGQGHLYKRLGDTDVSHLIEQWRYRQDAMKTATGLPGTYPIQGELIALDRTVQMRGAPWYRQTYFCLSRAFLQQYRLRSSFYAELAVAVLTGFLLGLAEISANGINFRGVFLHPYELLSSSADYSSVPEMSLLVGLAIGIIASSPGVKIFGEEKLMYAREASSGHNRFAYYLGKVLSTLPRIILSNLHFTMPFMYLATPRISWGAAFVANMLYFYCIYGLSSCVSMVTKREDGPLIATMTSLIVGLISGVRPSLHTVAGWHMTWLWRASPGTWLSEAYFTENVTPYRYLYQIDQAASGTGYKLGRFSVDLAVLFLLGTMYRVIAFGALRLFNRSRSR